jgi:hypothetical protein
MLAARHLGINPDIPAAELARSLKIRFCYKDNDLNELLQQVEGALHDPELSERTVLDLAQRLAYYTQSLKEENIAHADSVPRAFTRTN